VLKFKLAKSKEGESVLKTNKKNDSVHLVYSDIKKKMIDGIIKKDEKLAELHLCDAYNVSRLHVKEALKMLELENLVKYIPRRGYYAVGISMESIQEVALIRFSFDYVVCTYFAEHASDDQVRLAEKYADRILFFGEHLRTDDAIEESKRFYEIIYSVCPYKRIRDTLDNVESYIDLVRKFDHNVEGYTTRANKAIMLLIEGIKEKDPEKIRKSLYFRNQMILNTVFKNIDMNYV
jgi:DNA-binding GntR family transcriptional regulator